MRECCPMRDGLQSVPRSGVAPGMPTEPQRMHYCIALTLHMHLYAVVNRSNGAHDSQSEGASLATPLGLSLILTNSAYFIFQGK